MSDDHGRSVDQSPAGWVFLQSSVAELPDRWRQRAVAVWLLPLSPDEMDTLLEENRLLPTLAPRDAEIATLLVAGLPPSVIARRVGLSSRTVHRRLAALRERFGTGSTMELALLLAKRGF